MELKHKLLDHPFYQAWTKGEISKEQLSKYHNSYNEFIELMPVYWQKIISAFGENSTFATKVVNDETEHIALWQLWKSNLPEVSEFPRMNDIINELDAMTPSQLLGAIQSFEIQQPGVAETKKEGLMCHYGYQAEDLKYFDDHLEEEAHIAFGKSLAKRYANEVEFIEGFNKGAELFYNGLNKFIN